MILYLRDDNNTNLFEVEIYESNEGIEVKPHVYSNSCFHHIMKHSKFRNYIDQFIKEFKPLEELRGWYFEIYKQSKEPQDINSIITKLRIMLKDVADRLSIDLIED